MAFWHVLSCVVGLGREGFSPWALLKRMIVSIGMEGSIDERTDNTDWGRGSTDKKTENTDTFCVVKSFCVVVGSGVFYRVPLVCGVVGCEGLSWWGTDKKD